MTLLIPTTPFSLQRGTSLSNDVEMLQTDVMRFFAILALCLMAIFALVKALPMAPSDAEPVLNSTTVQPVIAPPDDLRAEAQSLQKQIARLKEMLAEIQTQVNAATAAARQSSSQASKAAKDEQAAHHRLAETQRELQSASESLAQTRTDLQNRAAKLDKLLEDIDRKQHKRSELKSQIEAETQKLEALQASLNRTREKISRPASQKQSSPKKPSSTQAAPEPKPKGFTLRFASDAALQELIVRGDVDFFALTGKKTWQLHLRTGQPAFSPVESPRKIYEMESSTVPREYSKAFRHSVAAFGRDAITWGVTLPARTSASISRLIAGRDGGDLLIMPDGEVILN
ncbi:MAG: hypothetical protein JRF72_14335 [Deltaproteobacteria bacterium]|jgi:uncharacterized protein YlxW (UPF0749 family)|nr:hypothetical protein [Deltaproteobacteria bacterium]